MRPPAGQEDEPVRPEQEEVPQPVPLAPTADDVRPAPQARPALAGVAPAEDPETQVGDAARSGPPEPPPAAATEIGAALPVLSAYADLLAGPGVERGLIGPRETPRLWERHLLNCAGPAELLDPGTTVVDLGSGAGLPGLVLAALRPDCRFVLVEPLLRRATFLTEAVQSLGVPNVEVRRARAEELAGRVEVDVVVARAVAPLDRLVGWALPLLRPGGRLLALKGDTAEAELDSARAALRSAGAAGADVVSVGSPAALTAARVVVVVRGEQPQRARRRR